MQLIENLAEAFDDDKYTDDYRSNLMNIIRAKMKGKKPAAKAKRASTAKRARAAKRKTA